MARVAINTGAAANDGTGDTLRAAGGIINSNFLEIYTHLGAGSTTTLSAPVWNTTNAGINTLRNVGIGTTNPRFALEVGAVGASGTSLYVNGNARITGIVTIGTSSITLNGSSNTINVGTGITINGSTGIISATSIVVGGTTLTGAAVTRIEAGSGISVDQNTGQVTITATGGGGTGAGTTWVATNAGIHTTKNVGIGTTNPTSALTVKGNTSLETLNVSGVSTLGTSNISGNLTFTGSNDLYLKDNGVIYFGDSYDLEIYHNGENSFIKDTGTGGLYVISSQFGILNSSANETLANFNPDGSVELYYDNSKKFETLGTGITVTGTTFTNQLSVSGVSTFLGTATFGNTTGNSGSIDVVDNSSGRTYISPGTITFNTTGSIQQIGTQQYFRSGSSGTSSYYFSNYYGGFDHELLFIDTNGNTRIAGNLNVSGISTLGTVKVSSGIVTATSGVVTYYGDTSNAVDGRWTLGADGTSNYTFTGIGFTETTSDPVLYLTRGRVYEFVNNSGGSHPFQIRVGNGGAAYSNGVTNNGSASGTIRFEVPFSAPNTLYYQCTNHSGMGATIFVTPRNEPAVGVRTTVTATTGSVGAADTTNLNINGFKTYSLLKVGITSAAWVVLYTDATSRTNDESRSYLTDPTPGSGVIAEVRSTSAGISTFIMSPGVIGWNNDVSVASTIYARVTNNESSTSTGIGVTLTVVKLED